MSALPSSSEVQLHPVFGAPVVATKPSNPQQPEYTPPDRTIQLQEARFGGPSACNRYKAGGQRQVRQKLTQHQRCAHTPPQRSATWRGGVMQYVTGTEAARRVAPRNQQCAGAPSCLDQTGGRQTYAAGRS